MQMTTAADGSPQNMLALERANEVHRARAALKRRVADGQPTVGEVISCCPRESASMTVFELLCSQSYWGAARARKFLAARQISETRTVSSLTDRQRRQLGSDLVGVETTRAGTAPERSLAQRREALQRANAVRSLRAAAKRDLKGGGVTIHSLLLDPPKYVETARVFDLLLNVPKYGRVKVNKVLTQCRISPSKTIGELSPRQRDEILKLLHHSAEHAQSLRRQGVAG